eukprot:3854762-Prymnesium_polylepis.1
MGASLNWLLITRHTSQRFRGGVVSGYARSARASRRRSHLTISTGVWLADDILRWRLALASASDQHSARSLAPSAQRNLC